MLRGEIRVVDLDPARGSVANKGRPAVVVSNDGANTTAFRLNRGVITVVPVTAEERKCVHCGAEMPCIGHIDH
jgi:mRNA interferase MazF